VSNNPFVSNKLDRGGTRWICKSFLRHWLHLLVWLAAITSSCREATAVFCLLNLTTWVRPALKTFFVVGKKFFRQPKGLIAQI